ncbi:MAG: ATP-binding cassette domain-containing protein [Chloroflexi bacterium]|nr:ATP-binding cassette domain-containing protein [Chloroflexota bacterium]
MTSIRYEKVDFRYRRSGPVVLDGFSWEVPEGRTVLLGPNGAGKTTLLSLGAAALQPWGGQVHLGPVDSARRRDRESFRRAVGWMPQHVRAVPGLLCREQVTYAGWLKGMSTREAWTAASAALSQVGMMELAERMTSQLSGGQLRRVGLAQALVHDARVLLLDEPTAGLDPAQRARFRETLAALPPEETVLVSTHQVDDLSELFDTVVVIDRGVIRYQGSVTAFLDLAPPDAQRPAEAAYGQLVSGEH